MAVAIRPTTATRGPAKCRRKFLGFFPKGFYDEKYIDWERARVVSRDLRDLRPRDMIDIQSFLWVQGSDEY